MPSYHSFGEKAEKPMRHQEKNRFFAILTRAKKSKKRKDYLRAKCKVHNF